MRALWVCISLTLVAAMAEACGGGEAQNNAATKEGGTGVGGTTGSGGASGSGGAGGSAGGAGNGGKSGTGASGSGGGGGAGGIGGASGGGSGGSAGKGTGGAPSDSGAADASDAGSSSRADGSADSSGDCGVVDPNKRIFVSSALYTGDTGGLVGADSKCQALADAAGLCGMFKAWLSDGTGDAAGRLTHATGNYVLMNGQVVASGWAGLTSGTLQHAIDRTETNGVAPIGTVTCGGGAIVPVWTGTTSSGAAAASGSCGNWRSTGTGVSGVFGSADTTNSAWTGMCQLLTVCPSTAALYCVEQ